MYLDGKTFEVDGIKIRFEVEGSVVTVFAPRDSTIKYDIVEDKNPVGQVVERPSWVEIAQFDPRDYV